MKTAVYFNMCICILVCRVYYKYLYCNLQVIFSVVPQVVSGWIICVGPPGASEWIISVGDYVDNSFTALVSSVPREVRLWL